MCNMNQANAHLNNKGRLDTLVLTVDPTEGCLESIEVAEETAAGIAVEIAAAAAVAELAVVEKERILELEEHRRWPWESFPCPFSQ